MTIVAPIALPSENEKHFGAMSNRVDLRRLTRKEKQTLHGIRTGCMLKQITLDDGTAVDNIARVIRYLIEQAAGGTPK